MSAGGLAQTALSERVPTFVPVAGFASQHAGSVSATASSRVWWGFAEYLPVSYPLSPPPPPFLKKKRISFPSLYKNRCDWRMIIKSSASPLGRRKGGGGQNDTLTVIDLILLAH